MADGANGPTNAELGLTPKDLGLSKSPNKAPEITSESIENSEARIWGEVTDSREYNQDHFRYLVHAFNQFSEGSKIGALIDEHSEAQGVDLLQQPELLGDRVSLSMSLIDQEHTITWGPGGILIKAPETNIVVASFEDAAVLNANRNALEAHSKDLPKLSANEVLAQTRPGKYNEVVALGTDANGNKLKLEGFFVIKDVDGDIADPLMKEKLATLAVKRGLPLVEITDSRYQQEVFFSKDREVTAQFGGKFYHLQDKFPANNFTVDTGVKNYFAPRDEIIAIVNHFVEKGEVSQEVGNNILTRYDEAYKLRMKPTVADDGDKSYISFRDGVGRNFNEYHSRAGKIYKVTKEGATARRIDISVGEFVSALDKSKGNMIEQDYQAIISRLPINQQIAA